MNLDPQAQKGRGKVMFLWRKRRTDSCYADSAAPHTGSSDLHQETPPVPSVEKVPEPVLDCRQPVRPALYQQIVVCRSF
ncbi:hypothetical protein PBY51_019819 [Eleginops maclovinus]|uniref:Uncharacterized protein n=1 Tax=Eleginops maclovinus TaxID=56733 RepID=A0AAN7XTC3_ELEMC|nr:hypothetical protein PBY51_019819 [Eleginops maclovinus]